MELTLDSKDRSFFEAEAKRLGCTHQELLAKLIDAYERDKAAPWDVLRAMVADAEARIDHEGTSVYAGAEDFCDAQDQRIRELRAGAKN